MSNRRNQRLAYFQGADEPVNTSDGVSSEKVNSNDPTKLGLGSKEGVSYERAPMAVPVGGDSRDWEQKWFEGAAAKTKEVMGPKGTEFDLKKEWLRIPEDEKIANAKVVGGFTHKASSPKDSHWTLYIKASDGSGRKAPILKATVQDIWGDVLTAEVAKEMGLEQYAGKQIWTNKEIANAVIAKTNTQHYFNLVSKDIKKEGFSATAYALTGYKGFIARAANGGKVTKAQMLEGAPESIAPEAPVAPEAGLDGGIGEALDAEVDNTANEADASVGLLEQKHEELEQAQTSLVEKTAPEETASVFLQLQDAEKMVDEAKKEMEVAAKRLRDKSLTAAQKIKFIKLTAEAQEEAIDTMQAADTEIVSAEEAIKKADEAIKAAGEVAGGQAPVEGAAPAEGGELMMEETNEAPVAAEAPVAEESMSIEAALKSGKAQDFVKAFLNKRKAERGEDKPAEQGKYQVRPEGGPKDGNAEIERAHPKGGHEVTDLTAGGKPENHGGRFDTVIEQHEHDLKVADKMPSGELSGKPVAVANSKGKTVKADAAAVAYYKELGYPADFAKGLNEEFVPGGNKIGAEEKSAIAAETQAKVIRAYELADEAVEKGFCERTAAAKSNLVKQVLAFDDKAFVAFKNVLDSARKPTVASVAPELIARASAKLPKIGLQDSGAGSVDREDDLVAKLSNLGWK